jgi:hypothetical protein
MGRRLREGAADHGAFPLEIEQPLVLMDDKFNVITFGTGDVLNGPQLFDLKDRRLTTTTGSKWPSTASCRWTASAVDRAKVDILFARHKNAHQQDVTREEATRRVMAVVDSVMDPEQEAAQPTLTAAGAARL